MTTQVNEVSAISSLLFAEDITTSNITTYVAINACSMATNDAYEAPQDGCIRGLGVTVETAPGGSYVLTFCVYVGGTATTCTTTITGTATTAYAAFDNKTAMVKAGDAIKCYIKESNSSAAAVNNILVYVLYQMGASNI